MWRKNVGSYIDSMNWNPKKCNNFYEAEYRTPESIVSAFDEKPLTINGFDISFIKNLMNSLDRI